MKTLQKDFLKICQTERGVLILMIFNLLLSIALIIFSIISLNPNASVVKVGYGDIGGYRDGSWVDMLAFPLLAVIFGVIHGFVTIRIFHKRGSGMAKFFLIATTMLILGTFLVLIRTLGEG
ncbi:MAG: hypothetical protein Q4F56_02535 [Candidatus Saccharibacteria bacterium]|nr:hypothetical protein [Candidatus Saccharibacteria bacterium]